MKKIMQTAFLMALFVSLNLPAFGQRVRHKEPEYRKGNLIERFKEDLNLSEAQAAEMEALQSDFRTEMKALRAQKENGETVDREVMKAKKEVYHEAIMSVLTTEQVQILEEKKAEIRQKRQERRNSEEFKAMKTEAKAYRDEHIRPVMLTQRQKLEVTISDVDKSTIADLRVAYKNMKAEMKAQREELKNQENLSDEAMREARKSLKEGIKEKYQTEHETLKALVEKYDEDITALYKEVAAEKEIWKEDLKEIKKEHFPKTDEKQGGHHKHKKGKGHKGMKKGKFLLLDPNETGETPVMERLAKVTVFPNPTNDISVLTYEVKEESPVIIELKNEAGNTVNILQDGLQKTGNYRQKIDFTDLKSGVYYLTINDGIKVVTEKVIVQ